ncbi:MAG TPA: type II secretion system protein GspG [Thermoanaerobaculia bacterium]|jgi:type II secretion system protein G
MTRKQKGFTLIELLIVVAIIGILAAIAIPNLLTAMQRSKQKRTMADIRSIATAWEAYATDTNTYNVSGQATYTLLATNVTDKLEAKVTPTYIKTLPRMDGWNKAYTFRTDRADVSAAEYSIHSTGKDGQLDGTYKIGPTSDFDNDIIYSNGSFVSYPEGIQTQ